MKYTQAMISEIENAAPGKVVESLVHDEVGDYWVMTFIDGSEISFRFMAELVGGSDGPDILTGFPRNIIAQGMKL